MLNQKLKQRKFLKHQQLALESAKPEVILSGAYGSGKSYALCNKITFLLTRYPGNRGFLCRKTLQSLKGSTLKTLLTGDGDLPPALPPEFIEFHNRTDRLIKLKNGSELYYGNMDIEFIKSMNFGFAAVDELTELTEEEWNALSGRLRLSGIPTTQLIAATNPAGPQHWVYNRAVTNPPRDKFGKSTVEFIQSSTLDNIYLPQAYIDNLKRTLFGFYYERYVLGKWVGNDDVVYDNFDFKKHLIPNFQVPKDWKRYRALDFGYRAPFFCGWFAVAGKDAKEYNKSLKPGDIVLYRELYYTQRTASVNAGRVKEFSVYADGKPEKFEWTVSDWDSGDRADFEAVGIYTIMANKDITVGIQKVRERLGNTDPTRGMEMPPRFFIFENTLAEHDPKLRLNLENGSTNNNPTRAAEEFTVYSWKKDKEEPEDDFNHALDGIRYFIMGVDGNYMWSNVPFMKV